MNIVKEIRERLGKKSKTCFGSKGMWKKLMKSTGNSLESMETQMDAIIKEMKKQKVIDNGEKRNKFIINRKVRREYQRKLKSKKVRLKK